MLSNRCKLFWKFRLEKEEEAKTDPWTIKWEYISLSRRSLSMSERRGKEYEGDQ